ncbi:MAG: hypothetical protein CVU48_06815 [Candidatus Cloacimonetes bacterium HGW-Cloacimonetes-1]|jgi:CRP-like cAMP-binding protein|nr:MAG: hypothetical protein CVU48_06815 [Candidatus Cloacimonetes bacterium HGW-Cloacimonetes-1]
MIKRHNEHPLYCYLDAAEILEMKAIAQKITYVAHEPIIQIGQRNRDILCLEEGIVSVQVEASDGAVFEVTRLSEGSLIGEMNFVIPSRRTANVVALNEVLVSVYPYQELVAILQKRPDLAHKIFAALNFQLLKKYLGMIH